MQTNKTSFIDWRRRRPTGLAVRGQAERAQAANREQAGTELAAKLEARGRAVAQTARLLREAERRRMR